MNKLSWRNLLKENYLKRVKKEGVTDDDLELWWAFSTEERKVIVEQDDVYRTALFVDLLKQGLDTDAVALRVKKFFPIYGNPLQTQRDNRPLPYELKDRVNRYIDKIVHEGRIDEFKAELAKALTYNDLVREKIREGLI